MQAQDYSSQNIPQCYHPRLHQKMGVFHKRHLYRYNLRGQFLLRIRLNLADLDSQALYYIQTHHLEVI